jgi:hypothetical protein
LTQGFPILGALHLAAGSSVLIRVAVGSPLQYPPEDSCKGSASVGIPMPPIPLSSPSLAVSPPRLTHRSTADKGGCLRPARRSQKLPSEPSANPPTPEIAWRAAGLCRVKSSDGERPRPAAKLKTLAISLTCTSLFPMFSSDWPCDPAFIPSFGSLRRSGALS